MRKKLKSCTTFRMFLLDIVCKIIVFGRYPIHSKGMAHFGLFNLQLNI